MIVKPLTEHHLEFLSLKGGCTGSPESTLVKMPHCWKLVSPLIYMFCDLFQLKCHLRDSTRHRPYPSRHPLPSQPLMIIVQNPHLTLILSHLRLTASLTVRHMHRQLDTVSSKPTASQPPVYMSHNPKRLLQLHLRYRTQYTQRQEKGRCF